MVMAKSWEYVPVESSNLHTAVSPELESLSARA